jgi:DNA-binding response OmpR family regulator
VEDNRDIREYVRSSFEEMYEVLTAADGKEGWDIAQSQIMITYL